MDEKRCDNCKGEIKMGDETVHYNGKIYCSLNCSDIDNEEGDNTETF